MKRKFGTILEKALIINLKKRAAEEDRPISEIVQEALMFYLSQNPGKEEALQAWERLDKTLIRVTDRDLKEVMELDMWEQ
ncbi:hypothetical protein MYX84_11020 [Acidobacteria bacterium AH-259-O06]|nr:hypothetical protein [Acidobacteria bacterium AH-259-O06]